MRHVDAKIKILLVLFYCYNFTFVSIINCDRQKFSIVTLHESKVHYAARHLVPQQCANFSNLKMEMISIVTREIYINTMR